MLVRQVSRKEPDEAFRWNWSSYGPSTVTARLEFCITWSNDDGGTLFGVLNSFSISGVTPLMFR